MVCPFIGADVFQIDREISVEFIEFHGGFVNIRFICRPVDNINFCFGAFQTRHGLCIHKKTTDIRSISLKLTALQSTIFQRGKNIIIIFCTNGTYHIYIILGDRHSGKI